MIFSLAGRKPADLGKANILLWRDCESTARKMTICRFSDVYVVVKNEIQIKIILTWFDSQFPFSSNPNKG